MVEQVLSHNTFSNFFSRVSVAVPGLGFFSFKSRSASSTREFRIEFVPTSTSDGLFKTLVSVTLGLTRLLEFSDGKEDYQNHPKS